VLVDIAENAVLSFHGLPQGEIGGDDLQYAPKVCLKGKS
jgi:hypothetical protein